MFSNIINRARYGFLFFLVLFLSSHFACTSKTIIDPLPEDTAKGYVKFYRSDDENYNAEFNIFQRYYGREEAIGTIDNSKNEFCIPVRTGINIFKVYAPGGKYSLKRIYVEQDKISPVEIAVSWSKGRSFDKESFFRWNVFAGQDARDPVDGECGLQVEAPGILEEEFPPEPEDNTETKQTEQASGELDEQIEEAQEETITDSEQQTQATAEELSTGLEEQTEPFEEKNIPPELEEQTESEQAE